MGFVGFLIWFYDYDFLLNLGGPNTPISDYIRSLFGVIPWQGGATFFPLKILVPIGIFVGIVLGWLYEKIKNRQSNIINN